MRKSLRLTKKELAFVQKYLNMPDRVELKNHEAVPLKWLLKKDYQYGNRLNMIYCAISAHHPLKQSRLATSEMWGKAFIDEEDFVKSVIMNLFQWFNTNCGRCDLDDLMNAMKNHSIEWRFESHKESRRYNKKLIGSIGRDEKKRRELEERVERRIEREAEREERKKAEKKKKQIEDAVKNYDPNKVRGRLVE